MHTQGTYYFRGTKGRMGGQNAVYYVLLLFFEKAGDKFFRGMEGRTEGQKAENYVPPLFFEKAGDNKLRITCVSKSHAYLQTMTKTPVKFQDNRHKTVGVVHTRYPLSIHFDRKNARKMTKFNLRKK